MVKETVEVEKEIQLPAYRKDSGSQFYKIISAEDMENVCLFGDNEFSYYTYKYESDIKNKLGLQECSEKDFTNAMEEMKRRSYDLFNHFFAPHYNEDESDLEPNELDDPSELANRAHEISEGMELQELYKNQMNHLLDNTK